MGNKKYNRIITLEKELRGEIGKKIAIHKINANGLLDVLFKKVKFQLGLSKVTVWSIGSTETNVMLTKSIELGELLGVNTTSVRGELDRIRVKAGQYRIKFVSKYTGIHERTLNTFMKTGQLKEINKMVRIYEVCHSDEMQKHLKPTRCKTCGRINQGGSK